MPNREPTTWGNFASELQQSVEHETAEKQNRFKFYKKCDYERLESYKTLRSSGRANLQRLEDALQYLFERNIKLGHMQKALMDTIKTCFLQTLFKHDLVPNLDYLVSKFKINELYDVLAIIYPRREGKTVVSAIFAACCAVSQEGNVLCYNLRSRQAKDWLELAIKYLGIFRNSPKFGWKLERQNINEFITIRQNVTGHVNSVKSYPGEYQGKGDIGTGQANSQHALTFLLCPCLKCRMQNPRARVCMCVRACVRVCVRVYVRYVKQRTSFISMLTYFSFWNQWTLFQSGEWYCVGPGHRRLGKIWIYTLHATFVTITNNTNLLVAALFPYFYVPYACSCFHVPL